MFESSASIFTKGSGYILRHAICVTLSVSHSAEDEYSQFKNGKVREVTQSGWA